MKELPGKWKRMKILITVKTYPTPSKTYEETVCTAGISENGEWLRLYPVSYRYLEDEKKYRKYQWMNVEVMKRTKDYRPDSYTPNLDSVVMGEVVGTDNNWRERKALLLPTVKISLEQITQEYNQFYRSLGMFKPKEIQDVVFEKKEISEIAAENKQLKLFSVGAPAPLETLEHQISYLFRCDDTNCRGHKLSIIDWEAGQLYRRLRHSFELKEVIERFRQKWINVMFSSERESYLIVGNRFLTPSFMVIGVFWPPVTKQIEWFANNGT